MLSSIMGIILCPYSSLIYLNLFAYFFLQSHVNTPMNPLSKEKNKTKQKPLKFIFFKLWFSFSVFILLNFMME